MKPFTPRPRGTRSITVTASSQAVKLTDTVGVISVRIYNADTQDVFIAFGESGAVAATTSGVPIPAGAIEVMQVRTAGGPLYAAAIGTAANSKNIYFTPGSGI